MQKYIINLVLVLACLAIVSIPLPVGAQSSACATVLTPTLSTTTASPGMNVGVFSRITNCSTKKQAYTVVVSSVPSCGGETVITSSRISFGGGETKLISVSYAIAPGTCSGSAQVSVSAYSGDVLLRSGATTLNIQ